MAPPPNQTRAKALADFRRLMRWSLVFAAAMIGLAFVTYRIMGVPITITMVIATIAGVGLSVLVGTGLMGLIFMSANSGRDDEAANHQVNHDDWVPPDQR